MGRTTSLGTSLRHGLDSIARLKIGKRCKVAIKLVFICSPKCFIDRCITGVCVCVIILFKVLSTEHCIGQLQPSLYSLAKTIMNIKATHFQ